MRDNEIDQLRLKFTHVPALDSSSINNLGAMMHTVLCSFATECEKSRPRMDSQPMMGIRWTFVYIGHPKTDHTCYNNVHEKIVGLYRRMETHQPGCQSSPCMIYYPHVISQPEEESSAIFLILVILAVDASQSLHLYCCYCFFFPSLIHDMVMLCRHMGGKIHHKGITQSQDSISTLTFDMSCQLGLVDRSKLDIYTTEIAEPFQRKQRFLMVTRVIYPER